MVGLPPDLFRKRTRAGRGEFKLCPIAKSVGPGEIAFREQLLLGFQPVLYIAPGLRTLIHIIEICPAGHLVG
jgi:hypothetical protein